MTVKKTSTILMATVTSWFSIYIRKCIEFEFLKGFRVNGIPSKQGRGAHNNGRIARVFSTLKDGRFPILVFGASLTNIDFYRKRYRNQHFPIEIDICHLDGLPAIVNAAHSRRRAAISKAVGNWGEGAD